MSYVRVKGESNPLDRLDHFKRESLVRVNEFLCSVAFVICLARELVDFSAIKIGNKVAFHRCLVCVFTPRDMRDVVKIADWR